MKSKQERKKLAIKYFIQQKVTEIVLTLLIISLIVFVPYLLGFNFTDRTSELFCYHGSYYYNNIWTTNYNCGNIGIWFLGLWLMIKWISITFASIGIILCIFWILQGWIESNWKKAKRRAGLE